MTDFFRGTPHVIEVMDSSNKGMASLFYAHLSASKKLQGNCLDCQYFSRSSYLKCAVNPQKQIGAECPDFEAKT